MTHTRLWLLAASLVAVTTGRAAALEHLAPGLNWVRLAGASSCPTAAQIGASVESRLGRALFVATRDAQLFVDGYVLRSPHGFEVTLEVSDLEGKVLGQRTLHFDGEDCSVIEPAVTMVIAVTLYPDSSLPSAGIALDPRTAAELDSLFAQVSADPDPASLPDRSTMPDAGAERDQPSQELGKSRPVTRSQPVHVSLAASGGAALGQLPGVALAGSAYAQLRIDRALPIEAGVSYLPAQTVGSERGSGEASFSLLLGSLAICPLQPAAAPTIVGCVGAEFGTLNSRGRDFVFANRVASDWVFNLRASGAWNIPLAGPLFLRTALLLSVPILQRNYTYRGPDNAPVSLFRMPQVAVRAEVGLGITF